MRTIQLLLLLLLLLAGCAPRTPSVDRVEPPLVPSAERREAGEATPKPEAEAVSTETPFSILAGKVVKVLDGDTIDVEDETGKKHRIRLVGIDAPEGKQAFGAEAAEALSKKVDGRQVRIEWRERDVHDRILGNGWLNERWINLEMVADGFAWHYKYYSDDADLAAAETAARAGRLGLWADLRNPQKPPAPPWDYRIIVFVTKTGGKYHRPNCTQLRKTRIPKPLTEARMEYEPCKTCKPPQ